MKKNFSAAFYHIQTELYGHLREHLLYPVEPQYRPQFSEQDHGIDQVASGLNVGMGYDHFDSLDDSYVGSFILFSGGFGPILNEFQYLSDFQFCRINLVCLLAKTFLLSKISL